MHPPEPLPEPPPEPPNDSPRQHAGQGAHPRLRRARALLVGVLAVTALAVPLAVFVQQTLPYQVPTNPAPVVALTPSQDAQARAFPTYTGAIPVINYHDISERPGLYSTTPTQFATHLAALRAAGFTSVPLRTVDDLLTGRPAQLPPRPILITFDDAVASQYVNADAALARYGYHAVAFIPTAFIAAKTPSYYLSVDELRHLARNGRWEIGSHTDGGHRFVRTGPTTAGPWLSNLERRADGSTEQLDDWQVRVARDLARSVDRLQDVVGTTPLALAYPFSAASFPTNDPRLPSRLQQIVARTFPIAFTASLATPSAVTPDSPRDQLPRLEVVAGTSSSDLLARLALMVPRAPSADPRTWSIPTGHGCAATARAVVVTSATYAECRPESPGSAWRNYRLRLAVSGVGPAATALVSVRNGPRGWAELALSDRRYVVRQHVRGHWRALASGRLARGGALHTVDLDLSGRRLEVTVDGVRLRPVPLDASLAHGAVGFGLAPRGRRTVAFIPLSVRANTSVRANAPAGG